MDCGDPVPTDPSAFAGLCFMGGPMSVNDPLPWIPDVLELIRKAVAADIPLIGHCLGGQLMSKALGAAVGANRCKEIGWLDVHTTDPAAAGWFGDRARFPCFHWHGETFTVPTGATRVLASAGCDNQAWAMGKHLAMQCHIEMTEELVKSWCSVGADEIHEASTQPTVQQPAEIERDLEARVQALHAVAETAYAKWVTGLKD